MRLTAWATLSSPPPHVGLERLSASARKGRDSRLFVLTRYVSWNLLRRVPLATIIILLYGGRRYSGNRILILFYAQNKTNCMIIINNNAWYLVTANNFRRKTDPRSTGLESKICEPSAYCFFFYITKFIEWVSTYSWEIKVSSINIRKRLSILRKFTKLPVAREFSRTLQIPKLTERHLCAIRTDRRQTRNAYIINLYTYNSVITQDLRLRLKSIFAWYLPPNMNVFS